jgi:parvulin-like peptidyl-prolyl isomerase
MQNNNEQNLEEVILEETLTPDSMPEEVLVVEEEIAVEKVSKIKAVWLATKGFVNRHLKIATAVATVIVILVLAFVFKGQFIAATVNGSVVTRHAVISELESVSGKNALESIITEKLINSEADKKGIKVSVDEVVAEIKIIEAQVIAQGGTLEQALSAQGLTQEIFEKQILLNKKLEKLLADKISVSDDEIKKYIADNKITIPAGQEETYNEQIKTQLQQQKLSSEASALIASLRATAKIKYFVEY